MFESICPDLDVASFGPTVAQAGAALLEACQLYIEAAIESNLPYLRPMPADEHPRRRDPDWIVRQFWVTVEIAVRARA